MAGKQKLELTWIGKEEQAVLEPRILIEDPEKSYGDPHSENMLIHGDNLLAPRVLEQKFAGKIKCICIDPPYNTDSAEGDFGVCSNERKDHNQLGDVLAECFKNNGSA